MIGMGDTDRYYTSSDYKYAFTYKSIIHDDYQEDRLLNDIAFLQLLYPISFTGRNTRLGVMTYIVSGGSQVLGDAFFSFARVHPSHQAALYQRRVHRLRGPECHHQRLGLLLR